MTWTRQKHVGTSDGRRKSDATRGQPPSSTRRASTPTDRSPTNPTKSETARRHASSGMSWWPQPSSQTGACGSTRRGYRTSWLCAKGTIWSSRPCISNDRHVTELIFS